MKQDYVTYIALWLETHTVLGCGYVSPITVVQQRIVFWFVFFFMANGKIAPLVTSLVNSRGL